MNRDNPPDVSPDHPSIQLLEDLEALVAIPPELEDQVAQLLEAALDRAYQLGQAAERRRRLQEAERVLGRPASPADAWSRSHQRDLVGGARTACLYCATPAACGIHGCALERARQDLAELREERERALEAGTGSPDRLLWIGAVLGWASGRSDYRERDVSGSQPPPPDQCARSLAGGWLCILNRGHAGACRRILDTSPAELEAELEAAPRRADPGPTWALPSVRPPRPPRRSWSPCSGCSEARELTCKADGCFFQDLED